MENMVKKIWEKRLTTLAWRDILIWLSQEMTGKLENKVLSLMFDLQMHLVHYRKIK